MAKHWRVERVDESELERALQLLDGDGFEVHETYLSQQAATARFVVVASKPLQEQHVRRFLRTEPVALRCADGAYIQWSSSGQPLRAVRGSPGPGRAWGLIHLEPRYGDNVVALSAGPDRWLSMPNETFAGPLVLDGPLLGSWQMLSMRLKDHDHVTLRSFNLPDGKCRYLGLDAKRRLVAEQVQEPAAAQFVLEPLPKLPSQELGVTLCW